MTSRFCFFDVPVGMPFYSGDVQWVKVDDDHARRCDGMWSFWAPDEPVTVLPL